MSSAFSGIREREMDDPAVTTSRMFGTDCLKVSGKVYAMEFKGALVIKLARSRAESLVSEGLAEVFDPGHGRPMKQWIVVGPDAGLEWSSLVTEAKSVVSGT